MGGTTSKNIRKWPRETLCDHDGGINCMAASEDESLLVTGSEDKTARLWELEGQETEPLRGPPGIRQQKLSDYGGDQCHSNGPSHFWLLKHCGLYLNFIDTGKVPKIGDEYQNNLRFADDIVLFGEISVDMQHDRKLNRSR